MSKNPWSISNMTDDEYADYFESERAKGPDRRDYNNQGDFEKDYDDWAEDSDFPPKG